jgi:hypothetical protein
LFWWFFLAAKNIIFSGFSSSRNKNSYFQRLKITKNNILLFSAARKTAENNKFYSKNKIYYFVIFGGFLLKITNFNQKKSATQEILAQLKNKILTKNTCFRMLIKSSKQFASEYLQVPEGKEKNYTSSISYCGISLQTR